jgi:hypothetical protein
VGDETTGTGAGAGGATTIGAGVGLVGGGATISMAGAAVAAPMPNCWRTRFVTIAEESVPQEGQTN